MTTIAAIRRASSLTFIGWIAMVSVVALSPDVVWAQPALGVEDGQGALQDEMTGEQHHEQGATEAMAEAQQHMGPHMKWTARRPLTNDDEVRAAQIAQTLRETLARYHDYRLAIKDGFQPFHPEVAQPHYHFTSKWRGFKAAFRFNPTEPTSLLYRKTANGFELEGAMYTAPKGMSEARLNQRVPLSVGQWHAHVNLCFPRKGSTTSTDWTRFGFKGSIATKEACTAVGGQFYSQIFGWMLHVYPFEQNPERIWIH